MSSVNCVNLLGRLTRDPEKRTAGSSTVVAFGLALNRKWKDASGTAKEEVTFVDVECWAKTGDIVVEYCKKGDLLYVQGRLKLDQWEKDGAKHQKIKVVGEQVQLMPKGDKSGGGSSAAPATHHAEAGSEPIPF